MQRWHRQLFRSRSVATRRCDPVNVVKLEHVSEGIIGSFCRGSRVGCNIPLSQAARLPLQRASDGKRIVKNLFLRPARPRETN